MFWGVLVRIVYVNGMPPYYYALEVLSSVRMGESIIKLYGAKTRFSKIVDVVKLVVPLLESKENKIVATRVISHKNSNEVIIAITDPLLP